MDYQMLECINKADCQYDITYTRMLLTIINPFMREHREMYKKQKI